MDAKFDYNNSFKSISTKLKKRFLRKPNVTEAIDEYTALGKQLETEECFGLSAYCMQQVARSYHSVGNTVSESSALQSAAKQYINAEEASGTVKGSISLGEDLLSAISVYEEAIKLHCDQNERQLAGKLCLELADILVDKFDHYFEAIPYYERAISLFSYVHQTQIGSTYQINETSSIQALLVQAKLATLKVFTCDYNGALGLYSDICNSIMMRYNNMNSNGNNSVSNFQMSSSSFKKSSDAKAKDFDTLSLHSTSSSSIGNVQNMKPTGYFASLLVDADICKLLLLLYLKPIKLKPEHSATLEVYSWFQAIPESHAYTPVSCMDKDLFILLQSFVMVLQSQDSKLIKSLQTELWSHFNEVQNHLTHLISQQLSNSSQTDELLIQ